MIADGGVPDEPHDLDVRPVHPEDGLVLHKLRDHQHHAVEEKQRGRAGVQRVRPLLQAARGEQTSGHEEGRDSDEETKTEGPTEKQGGQYQNRR